MDLSGKCAIWKEKKPRLGYEKGLFGCKSDKRLSHLRLSAGFSTWRPFRDRLLWFRRAFPSTTLDKQVFLFDFDDEE
jgi:hypothetical protein